MQLGGGRECTTQSAPLALRVERHTEERARMGNTATRAAKEGFMNDLPEPLTPADSDVRAYQTMPLNVGRLRDSGIAAHENAEVFRAAVLLWCASWHQVPAGSLPDDDRELAAMAGYGRFIAVWKQIREEALRGFIKCSDGRLYHPVVAEVVLPAWEARKGYVERSRKANEAKMMKKTLKESPKDTPKDTYKENGSDLEGSLNGGLGHPSERNGTEHKNTSADALVAPTTNPAGESDQVTPPAPAKSRGTRLAPDWYASSEERQYARLIGFTDDDIDQIEEDFRLWWPAQAGAKGVKMDWVSTWKTWVRTEGKKRGHIKSGTVPNGRGQQQSSNRIGAFHQAGLAVAGKRISGRVG